jgi:ribosomal protection tetracycline resistance protein
LLRSTVNLGILAHVDAGKTTLSERLLYAAGVIGEIGRVDDGTTQTDSLALERQRGITIRSAVVSLEFQGTAINLIDTPGHPDFIAEVDRVLGVLDGAVLVISAVEGVQPQTRVLMRALRRMGVPTLLFINKTDRRGADVERVLGEITRRLEVLPVPMGRNDSQAVLTETLTVHNEALLADYVQREANLTETRLQDELARQTRQALVYPVFAGSAVTGAGVDQLIKGLITLLPKATGDTDGPGNGSVFKIERGPAGEKIAYIRMFSGTLRMRDRIHPPTAPTSPADKVTGISVFAHGSWARQESVSAGQIGKLWGLSRIKVGDPIGDPPQDLAQRHFAPPALEAVIVPVRNADQVALRSALAQLAEQDPLINVRSSESHPELAVSLYGEVQKEVIQATLAADFGIAVVFEETTPLYLERPRRPAEAAEILNAGGNPHRATIGLRIEPATPGSGVTFQLEVDYRGVPLYVYRNLDEFAISMEQYVRDSLREGLYGWPVSDCRVRLIQSNYSSPDGPPATRGPLSTAADFRKLTPIVLRRALESAGTAVCEPMSRVRINAPLTTLGPLLTLLNRLRAAVAAQEPSGADVTIEAVLPATAVQDLHRRLPALTSGEGVLESAYAGHQRLPGPPPVRRRATDLRNPGTGQPATPV